MEYYMYKYERYDVCIHVNYKTTNCYIILCDVCIHNIAKAQTLKL